MKGNMKFTAIFVLILMASFNANANLRCIRLFEAEETFEKNVELETETQSGKPRYYTVRNYHYHRKSELNTYLKSIQNLTQFSEKLSEINSFMPDRTRIPSEAFYIANQMIPLIESYLKSHDVKYRIETFESADETRTRRSMVVIEENSQSKNPLNLIAENLGRQEKILFIVDPIELFYGYEHYNQSQGKLFDMDAFTPVYAMSFRLLLHSQRTGFDMQNLLSRGLLLKTDPELHKLAMEFVKPKVQDGEFADLTGRAESQAKTRQEKEAKIQAMIEAARNKKASN